jgi:hypothetical protein
MAKTEVLLGMASKELKWYVRDVLWPLATSANGDAAREMQEAIPEHDLFALHAKDGVPFSLLSPMRYCS